MLDKVSLYVCALVWLTYDVPVVCPDDLGISLAHCYNVGSAKKYIPFYLLLRGTSLSHPRCDILILGAS